MQWKLAQPNGNVLVVKMTHTGQGWRQWFLKLADVHFDSVFCNRKLLKGLLDEAVEREAPINVYGDLLDVMQGKNDRRSDSGEMRKEYVGVPGKKYLNAVVEDTVEFFKPYAHLIMDMSEGNHEASNAKYGDFSVLEYVCELLGVQRMRYAGWIRYQMKKDTGGHKCSRWEYFHHGSGGDSPVTLGMIGTARNQEGIVADIYVGGHNHNEFKATRSYAIPTPSNKIVQVDALHINVPSLKDEWSAYLGYHVETGKKPKPIGGAWMFFEWHPRERNNINVDALKAR